MAQVAGRRALVVVLALLVALGAAASPIATPAVRGATPDLALVTDARYEVLPEERIVRVTIDIRATNNLVDTATRRYYFDRAFLAVLPGTTGFSVSGGSGKPTVRVTQRTSEYSVVQVTFGQRLAAGRTAQVQLRFDLPDPGGDAIRDVRIGTALVSFPVWAFGTDATPGSSVTVVFPPGFTVEVAAGDLPPPTTDPEGRTVFATGALERPLDFFAYFIADRLAAYVERAIEPVVGDRRAPILVRAWPDDAAWSDRVVDLFERGLPVLHDLIGLPWPREDVLVVQETVARSTGGYAGLFDPATGRIEVAYYADGEVILHEAAHAWFNGALLADRWANEAFASWYALAAADALGEPALGDELTDALRDAAIPLNAWGPVGFEERATEDYAYAASLALAREVAERAGEHGLRRVWRAAAGREGAYRPPTGTIERISGAPDWRGLLDLLEEYTTARYDDLWRTWVVRDPEAALLDERLAAREAYERTLASAAGWRLPPVVRDALRTWQFERASSVLAEAAEVLERRDALARAAADAGLTPSGRLRTVFETDGSFVAAAARADAELRTVEAVVAAQASRIDDPDVLEAVGLLWAEPEAALAAAVAAYEEGDLVGAVNAAAVAQDLWLGAADVGRNRVLTVAGATLFALLVLALGVSAWWARRPRGGAVPAVAEAGERLDAAEPPHASP